MEGSLLTRSWLDRSLLTRRARVQARGRSLRWVSWDMQMMPLWRIIKGEIINPTIGEIILITVEITNPAIVLVCTSIITICSKLTSIVIEIMLTSFLVRVVACSALAPCIPKHMPRIVEVFIINMKIGDPGDDQLQMVKLLLLSFWQFFCNFCLPPGLVTNYSAQ